MKIKKIIILAAGKAAAQFAFAQEKDSTKKISQPVIITALKGLPCWFINSYGYFYYNLKKIAVKQEDNFGLEISNVWVEKYLLMVLPVKIFS